MVFQREEIVFGQALVFKKDNTEIKFEGNENARIIYVISGSVILFSDSTSFILEVGTVAYVPARCTYIKKCLTPEAICWHLEVPQVRMPFDHDYISTLKSTNLLKGLAEKIVSWGRIKISEKSESKKRLVMSFLEELSLSENSGSVGIKIPVHKALKDVARQIIANPSDKNNIDYWAKIAGMSRRSFTSHFNRETGLTFAIWRQRLKLKVSITELALGRSVKQVSDTLGFSSPSAFIELFKKQFGQSPKKYILDQISSKPRSL